MAAKQKKSRINLHMWDFFCTFAAQSDANKENYEKTNHPCNRCDGVRGMQ